MLVHQASHMSRIHVACELRVTFGVELQLNRGFYLMYIPMKYIFMECKNSASGRTQRVVVLFLYSASNYMSLKYCIVSMCVCVCVCVCNVQYNLHYQIQYCKTIKDRKTTGVAVCYDMVFCCLLHWTCFVSSFLFFTWSRNMKKDSDSCIICKRKIL
jgi:hypothetical protein